MIDIQKQIAYWSNSAAEDWDVARDLINRDGRSLQGLFFVHLSLEKLVKALVCKQTNDIPPKIHDLLRLIELTKVALSPEQKDFFGKMNLYNIEGRYPDMAFPKPPLERAKLYLEQAREIIEWLSRKL
jgi:HEPN domain-containing protein